MELKRSGSFNNRAGNTEQAVEQGEALAIEDLLDFTNEDICGSIEISYGASQDIDSPPVSSIIDVPTCDKAKDSSVMSVVAVSTEKAIKQSHTLSVFDADIAGSSELCIPCDDVAELEWLSNFVEESFSSGDGAVLAGGVSLLLDEKDLSRGSSDNKLQQRPMVSPVSVLNHQRTGTHFSTSTTTTSSNSTGHGGLSSLVPDPLYLSRPGRARSKRCRTAVCFWNTRILSIADDCCILEASSTSKLNSQELQSSSSSDSEDAGFSLGYDDAEDLFPCAPSKKMCGSKSSHKGAGGTKVTGTVVAKQAAGGPVADGRRCLHCGSQKTPQWRAGPMGPKTLCNACGVRYKSGRLLPEYRPAASPTFVESIHSNSHRRVLEMRRQRAESVFGSSHVDQQLGVC